MLAKQTIHVERKPHSIEVGLFSAEAIVQVRNLQG